MTDIHDTGTTPRGRTGRNAAGASASRKPVVRGQMARLVHQGTGQRADGSDNAATGFTPGMSEEAVVATIISRIRRNHVLS